MARRHLWLVAIVLVQTVHAGFYALPGVTPHNFEEGDELELKVARIDSVKTQMPFPYYELPFCQPEERVHATQQLGASLRGDRIELSPYKLNFERDEACKILCKQTYSEDEMKKFTDKVQDGYRAYWLVDNLPVATKTFLEETDEEQNRPPPANSNEEMYTYERGYEIGQFDSSGVEVDGVKPGEALINNHVRMTVKYHKQEGKPGARIVAFEAEPFSVAHKYKTWDGEKTTLSTCKPLAPVTHTMTPQKLDKAGEIVWTYDIQWIESSTRWASRWDMYLLVTDDQVHWFSVFNSLVTVVFLSGMVAIILLRTLNADINTYNELDFDEDGREDTGWKLVYADVFRPPQHVNLLSALVGTGSQLFFAGWLMLLFACFGFVSPAHRGGLMTAMLLCFVLMGTLSGYCSVRNYTMLDGKDWKQNCAWAALLCPGIIFSAFFFLNLVLWSQGSSGAVPFSALLKMFFMCFGIHVPLAVIGGYFANKRDKIEHPCRVNILPRTLPEKEWYLHPILTIFLGGVLPFGAIFIELYFVLSSIWLRHYYYVFGFMLLVFLILTITCSEMNIVMCYIYLCHGDYEWWWRSFLTSGSCAIHVFLYSIFYYNSQLDISKTLSMFLYFGYNLIIAFVFFILTGTIGYQSCLMFVRRIYSEIKLD